MAVHHRPTRSTVVKSISADFSRTPAIVGAVVWVSTDSTDVLVADAATVTTSARAPWSESRPSCWRDLKHTASSGRRRRPGGRPAEGGVRRTAHRHGDAGGSPYGGGVALRDHLGDEIADLDVRVTTDLESALLEADVVCCATPATEPLFRAASLPSVVHVNAIGSYRHSMRELPDELLATATVVVDQREAALAESRRDRPCDRLGCPGRRRSPRALRGARTATGARGPHRLQVGGGRCSGLGLGRPAGTAGSRDLTGRLSVGSAGSDRRFAGLPRPPSALPRGPGSPCSPP